VDHLRIVVDCRLEPAARLARDRATKRGGGRGDEMNLVLAGQACRELVGLVVVVVIAGEGR